MMLISQSDDHRPADVGETEAEVAEREAELDREMGRGAKIRTKKSWDAKIHRILQPNDKQICQHQRCDSSKLSLTAWLTGLYG